MIVLGSEKLHIYEKNVKKAPTYIDFFSEKCSFFRNTIITHIISEYIILVLIGSEKGYADHLVARF